MGVRPFLNMRAGLTFVREVIVWRTIYGLMAQNCHTRAKSRKSTLSFLTRFLKKVLKRDLVGM